MKYFIYILSFTLLLSCNKKDNVVKKDKASIKIYSEEEYNRKATKNNKIVIVDTMCSYETQRAIKDINKGILSIHTNLLWSKNYRPKFQDFNLMANLLTKYHITIDTSFSDYNSGCLRVKGFERYCYEEKMLKEIENRFGKNLIDSLSRIVDKQYVIKHPNELYDMQNCDYSSIYPDKNKFKGYFDEANDFFKKQFIYPKGYKFKNEKSYSYTDVDFILNKNGKISNLKVESTFQNKENEKYKSYFENFVKQFILDTKWTPAKSSGIKVNANFRTVFFHK